MLDELGIQWLTLDELNANQLINSDNRRGQQNEEESERVLYTWDELLTRPKVDRPMLLQPFLHSTGLAAIAGPPDSGKSTFCRQLAASVAMGKSSFCGLPLRPQHDRALYVSTEEPVEDITDTLSRQWEALAIEGIGSEINRDAARNLRLVFSQTIDPQELHYWIDTALRKERVDLVVIDSFGDVFTGRDGNSNIEVRRTLHPYYLLATRHKCLILFVAHLNKSAYTLQPDQVHVQGGSALLQKVRVTLDLRSEPGTTTKYLTVTKGNLIPEEYKAVTLKLELDDTTLSYRDHHEVIELTERLKTSESKASIDWSALFGTETELTTAELKARLLTHYNLHDRQARERIASELERVEVGVYRRASP